MRPALEKKQFYAPKEVVPRSSDIVDKNNLEVVGLLLLLWLKSNNPLTF